MAPCRLNHVDSPVVEEVAQRHPDRWLRRSFCDRLETLKISEGLIGFDLGR